jgi:GNAT superfamily N-acetyltransferase
VKLRDATSDDADAIGRVHVDSWRTAYSGIVPDAHLATLSPVTRAGRWRKFLADAAGARFILVADDDAGELIGFAAGGPERSGDPNYLGELYAIYLVASHWRRGVGRELARAVARRLAATGTRSMLVWVLEANTRGRTFYETLGGVVVRTQPIEIGGAQLIEIAYGWSDLAALLKSGTA